MSIEYNCWEITDLENLTINEFENSIVVDVCAGFVGEGNVIKNADTDAPIRQALGTATVNGVSVFVTYTNDEYRTSAEPMDGRLTLRYNYLNQY